jgi:hypothetical protein
MRLIDLYHNHYAPARLPEAVGRFCDQMDDALLPRTVQNYCAAMKRFLLWVASQGHESAGPALEALAARRREAA